MSDLLSRADSVADRVLPALFAEMNSTGHAGHCVYVSRVLDFVFKRLGVRSEPLCVDYEFANPAAVEQMAKGQPLKPPALIGKTGSREFDGYDHHVVTLIRDGATALLLDLTIIQLERHMPGVSIPPVRIKLPWPWMAPLSVEIGGGRLTYSFRPNDTNFKSNEQWTDVLDAKKRADSVLQRMKS